MRRIQRQSNQHHSSRRGGLMVIIAVSLVVILGLAALSIDIGRETLFKTQLQATADASALAAAARLNQNADQADVRRDVIDTAMDVARRNSAGGFEDVLLDPNLDVELGRRTFDPDTGEYNLDFGPGAQPYNVVRVTPRLDIVDTVKDGNDVTEDRRPSLLFASVLGANEATLRASAIATFQPRDMMLVMDNSGSMRFDSLFRDDTIEKIGVDGVEQVIEEMWEDLGSPTYGDMEFEPQYITVSGQPAYGAVPHIDVTWKGTEVYVVSTKDLSNVVLYFSDGSTQKFDGLYGNTGSFRGTGYNYNKLIITAWVKSGNNQSGDGPGYGERFNLGYFSTIRRALGIDNVYYPYPSGSWNEFILYALFSDYLQNADQQYKFGMLSFVHFVNDRKPLPSQTPDLYRTRQQPIGALKDSVDLLVDYLREVEANDRIGLAIYSTSARLESGLTDDLDRIKDATGRQQPNGATNISEGMRLARLELEDNSRDSASRMMVLMTDGQANRPGNPAYAKLLCLEEAARAEEAGIRVMTISLGLGADTDLMEQIAEETNGIHFRVPGGTTVAELEEQLKRVFAEIAADRPIKLIK